MMFKEHHIACQNLTYGMAELKASVNTDRVNVRVHMFGWLACKCSS